MLCRFDDAVDQPSKSAPDVLLPELFLTRNPGLGGSNLIIKRSLYRDLGGFDESFPACNDMDFCLRLSLRGACVAGSNMAGCRNDSCASTSTPVQSCVCLRAIRFEPERAVFTSSMPVV